MVEDPMPQYYFKDFQSLKDNIEEHKKVVTEEEIKQRLNTNSCLSYI